MKPKFGVEIYMPVFTTHIIKRKTCLKYIHNEGTQIIVSHVVPHRPYSTVLVDFLTREVGVSSHAMLGIARDGLVVGMLGTSAAGCP